MSHSTDVRSRIAGESPGRASGELLQTFDPSTGLPNTQVAVAGREEVDQAVAVAGAAWQRWWRLPSNERAEAIWAWGDVIRRNVAELALLDAQDVGRVVSDSLRDVESAVRWTRYWANSVDRLRGEQVPASAGTLMYNQREPLGVYGIITPWNAPSTTFVARVVSAIACGNGVIVKPSEHASRSALRLAELTEEAGIPVGLVNVVVGDSSTGHAITEHPGIGGISFTGSVPTGRRVGESAGRTLKKAVLELGGKSPAIIFPDADLDLAVRASTWGVFANAGQICTAGTRLLVHRSVADSVTQALVARARLIRVGSPFDDATHIGPLAFERQRQRVLDYIEQGRNAGANLALGGDPINGDTFGDGFFVEPTIFTDVTADMSVAREEIFGPVLSVMVFDDEEDAVALANDVDYGLSATLWTNDLGRAARMINELEAGSIYVNTPRTGDPALAFGGSKQSGVGNAYADGAVEGATRLKSVAIRHERGHSGIGWADV